MSISKLVRFFSLLLELVHLKKLIFNLSHEKEVFSCLFMEVIGGQRTKCSYIRACKWCISFSVFQKMLLKTSLPRITLQTDQCVFLFGVFVLLGFFLFFQVQYTRLSWTELYVTNPIMSPVELCSFKISWVIVCYEYILIPMSCEQIRSHSLSWAICFFIFVPGLISVRVYSLPDKMCVFALFWDQIFQEPEVLLWHLRDRARLFEVLCSSCYFQKQKSPWGCPDISVWEGNGKRGGRHVGEVILLGSRQFLMTVLIA